jgi:hypothetical protein
VSEPLAVAAAAAVAWTAAIIVAHVALFRLARVERRARALVLLFVAGAAGEVATCRLLMVDGWRTACGVALIACAFILYMPCYYMVAASFSARMLVELVAAPQGLTWDELAARYPAPVMIAGRLQSLRQAGYVTERGDAVALTPKGTVTARTFALVKRVWRLGPGG